jgi:hypothetical protein
VRYWLTPPEDEQFDAKVTDICDLYREAPDLAQAGERVMSTDELTGVQALERKHPSLPLAPGKVERREFEYIRHGTRSFIISRDVVTGQIIEPYGGPSRTEADFLQHVQAVVSSDGDTRRWHFVVDNPSAGLRAGSGYSPLRIPGALGGQRVWAGPGVG